MARDDHTRARLDPRGDDDLVTHHVSERDRLPGRDALLLDEDAIAVGTRDQDVLR